MNINIYLEDELGKMITENAKVLGMTRNALIREALKTWLNQHKVNKWPQSILNYQGVDDFPRIESYRDELDQPKEDPFQ